MFVNIFWQKLLHVTISFETPGLLATDIHIQIQIILTINLSEYVLINPINPHMFTHKHINNSIYN